MLSQYILYSDIQHIVHAAWKCLAYSTFCMVISSIQYILYGDFRELIFDRMIHSTYQILYLVIYQEMNTGDHMRYYFFFFSICLQSIYFSYDIHQIYDKVLLMIEELRHQGIAKQRIESSCHYRLVNHLIADSNRITSVCGRLLVWSPSESDQTLQN